MRRIILSGRAAGLDKFTQRFISPTELATNILLPAWQLKIESLLADKSREAVSIHSSADARPAASRLTQSCADGRQLSALEGLQSRCAIAFRIFSRLRTIPQLS